MRTFSIGFPGPGVRRDAATPGLAAERFGTIHEEFQVRPDAMEILPRLVWHYDEPFADSSAVPTWYVSQLTRQHVTVALTGDGGDELFAGYPRYRAVWLAEGFDRLPRMVRRLCAGGYWQRLPSGTRQKSLSRRWKRFVEMLEPARRRGDIWNGSRFSTRPGGRRSIATTFWRRAARRRAGASFSPPPWPGPTAATRSRPPAWPTW